MKDPAQRAKEEKERLIRERDELLNPPASIETPATETPASTETPAVEVPVSTETPKEETVAYWKNRFEVVQGKLNSEIPSMAQELRLLREENADMKRQITELNKPALQIDEETGKPLYVSPLVTDEIRQSDTYQYYLAEFGQTYAERQAEMAIKAAQSQVKPVQEELANNSAQTAEEKFHSTLSSLCPEWQGLNEGINVDDNFVTWLEESFAIGSFRDAYRNADIETMASIINKYKSTIKAPAPKPTPPPAPPRAGGGMQTNLEANKGEILKMADLEALYQDFSRGVYRGKEAEYEAKKKVFLQARAEGRLV